MLAGVCRDGKLPGPWAHTVVWPTVLQRSSISAWSSRFSFAASLRTRRSTLARALILTLEFGVPRARWLLLYFLMLFLRFCLFLPHSVSALIHSFLQLEPLFQITWGHALEFLILGSWHRLSLVRFSIDRIAF